MPSKYSKDYYLVLGLERGATLDEIKAAFRRLAKETHPDAGKCPDPQVFQEVNEAYEILSNPVKRMEYEESFFGVAPRPLQRGRSKAEPPSEKPPAEVQLRPGAPFQPSEDYAPSPPDSLDEKALRARLRENRADADAKLKLAATLLRGERKPMEAERLLADLLRDDPCNPALMELSAIARCRLGDIAEAQRRFQAALSMRPECADAYTCLVCIRHMSDPGLNVAFHLQKAPDAAKTSHRYHMLMGEFLYRCRNYLGALSSAANALRIWPENPRGHYLMARCLFSVGEQKEAMKYFASSLALDPCNVEYAIAQQRIAAQGGTFKIGKNRMHKSLEIEHVDRPLLVDYNRNLAVDIDLHAGDVVVIDLEILEGGPANFIFMDASQYDAYRQKKGFRYYPDATALNTMHINAVLQIPSASRHLILIENSGFTDGGAQPDVLNNRGVALVRLQLAIASPAGPRRSLADSMFFGSPSAAGTGFDGLMQSSREISRKRSISYRPY